MELPANEISWLVFSQGCQAPMFAHNWTSYYEWRGLPLKSLAALLLHWPLSIYRLLYLLGLVSSEGSRNKRRKLNIHYLGVEVRSSIIFSTARLTSYQYFRSD
jgi:hypothetical protein